MSKEKMEPREELEELVRRNGGWVNTHAHIDRSHIISPNNWHLTADTLQAKWDYTDHFKRSSTVRQILGHMSCVVEAQLTQGVQALGSFIDCDSVVRDKNLRAAEMLKQRYGTEIQLVFMSQPIKGLHDDEERAWFEHAANFVDIVGGLPERDGDSPGGKELHFDRIFQLATDHGKPLHIHVDQFNSPDQRDTEIAIKKTIEYDYAGRVALIHCISLAAQDASYRQRIYKALKRQNISVVSCPTAWIDSRRNEVLAPSHNAITPVDEMLPAGVNVAIGTDNIADIYKPFSDGNMWTELRFLLEATHTYDLSALANIATTNGLIALGLAPRV